MQSVGGLRTPVLAGVETVDGLFPQRIGDLFGIFAPPTQKENRIAVVRNDFGRILVDSFQLRLVLYALKDFLIKQLGSLLEHTT